MYMYVRIKPFPAICQPSEIEGAVFLLVVEARLVCHCLVKCLK